MEDLIRDLGYLIESLEEKDPEDILERSLVFEQKWKSQLSSSALGELKLIEACAASSVRDPNTAEKFFLESIEHFKKSTLEDHIIRAEIFFIRFLIQNNRLEEAQKKIQEISALTESLFNPYLDIIFGICKSEWILWELKLGNHQNLPHLPKELEKTLEASIFLDFPELGYNEEILINHQSDPGEFLLDYYYKSGRYKEALVLMQKLKIKHLRRDLIFRDIHLKSLGAEEFHSIETQIDRLKNSIQNYLIYLSHIYPFTEELKKSLTRLQRESQEYYEPLQNLLNAFVLRKTQGKDPSSINLQREEILKVLKSELDTFYKCIEDCSFISPISGQFAPSAKMLIPMVPVLLEDKTVAIDYYLGEKSFFIAVITCKNLNLYKVDRSRGAINTFIEKLNNMGEMDYHGGDTHSSQEEKYNDVFFELYRILISPFEAELEEKNSVYVIPHSYLYHVPFSSLYNGRAYWGDNYNISVLPALTYIKKFARVDELHLNKNKFIKLIRQNESSSVKEEENSFICIAIDPFDPAGKEGRILSHNDIPFSDVFIYDKGISSKNFKTHLIPVLMGNPQGDFQRGGILPPVIILPQIDYDSSSHTDSSLNFLCSFAFSAGSAVIIYNLWKTPQKICDTFINKFISGLNNKNIIEAFNDAKTEIIKRFGSHPAGWSGFVLQCGFLTAKICKNETDEDSGFIIKKLYQGKKKLLAAPVIVNGAIITGGEDKCITAINAKDGSMLWKYKTMDWVNDQIAIDDGIIYFGSMDKRVIALESRTGRKKWELGTRGWIMGRPAVSSKLVYAASKDGHLYMLYKPSGEIFKKEFMGGISKACLQLKDNKLIAFIQNNEHLKIYCYSSRNYEKVWDKSMPGGFSSEAVIEKDSIYYITESGKLCCINIASGRIRWEVNVNAKKNDSPMIVDNILYLLTEKSEILAISTSEGKIIWKEKTVSPSVSSMALYRDKICLICDDSYIYGYNSYSGEEEHKWYLYGITGKKLTTDGCNLYVFNSDKGIYLLGDPLSLPKFKNKFLQNQETIKGDFLHSIARFDRIGASGSSENYETAELTMESQVESIESKEQILDAPLMVKDMAVIIKSGNIIEAINLIDMTKIWSVTLEEPIEHTPALKRGMIIAAGSKGNLYYIDIRNGKIIEKINTSDSFSTSPAGGMEGIFTGSSDGFLYCVSYNKGKIQWQYDSGSPVVSTPLYFKNSVIFSCQDGSIHRVDEASGNNIWKIDKQNLSNYPPQIKNDKLFYITTDSTVNCINANSSRVLWKYQYKGDECAADILLTDTYILIPTKKALIHVLDFATGSLTSQISLTGNVSVMPVECGSNFIFASHQGALIVVDRFTGKTKKEIPLGAMVLMPMIVRKKEILLVEDNRRLKLLPLKICSKTEETKTEEINNDTEEEKKKRRFEDDDLAPPKSDSELQIKPRPRKRRTRAASPFEKDDEMQYLYYFLIICFTGLGVYSYIVKNPGLVIFSLFALFLCGFFLIVGQLQTENRRIKSLFNQFVPSHLLDGFIKGGQTEEKEITVIFQDIYNYTTISESITNDELFALLQEIDVITNKIVSKNGGEIMSYIGDAYMITFNAVNSVEDPGIRAVITALEINNEMESLSRILTADKKINLPCKLKMGYGIHTGKALVGIRGGKSKLEPFVLGDTPNVAARLQSLTRELGVDIILSATANEEVANHYTTRSLGKIRLKGKANPIEIYSISRFSPKTNGGYKIKEREVKNKTLSNLHRRAGHIAE